MKCFHLAVDAVFIDLYLPLMRTDNFTILCSTTLCSSLFKARVSHLLLLFKSCFFMF